MTGCRPCMLRALGGEQRDRAWQGVDLGSSAQRHAHARVGGMRHVARRLLRASCSRGARDRATDACVFAITSLACTIIAIVLNGIIIIVIIVIIATIAISHHRRARLHKALPEQGILLLACTRRCLNKASTRHPPPPRLRKALQTDSGAKR